MLRFVACFLSVQQIGDARKESLSPTARRFHLLCAFLPEKVTSALARANCSVLVLHYQPSLASPYHNERSNMSLVLVSDAVGCCERTHRTRHGYDGNVWIGESYFHVSNGFCDALQEGRVYLAYLLEHVIAPTRPTTVRVDVSPILSREVSRVRKALIERRIKGLDGLPRPRHITLAGSKTNGK